MKRYGLIALLIAVPYVGAPASADDDIQWVRVTVLLESGSRTGYPVEGLVIPGAVSLTSRSDCKNSMSDSATPSASAFFKR